ncbi:MAG: arsenic-transporting ATPase [Candidatus Aminicenantes bacterium RBG_16_63_16]|nr:MAG: arsenic-transporting ATPase [Candidatus Aminicenantes bacterium RBG_16_63_16]
MRTILFTGKGGVGKTTLAAATALRCARHGHKTLIISTDAAHSLSDSFERQLGNTPAEIIPNLYGQEISALEEIESKWGEIKTYLNALFASQGLDTVEAEELSVFPGMEELFSLMEIRQYSRTGEYDVIIVDCAPTADTLRLLSAPEVTSWYLKHIFPVQRTAARAVRPVANRILPFPFPDDAVFAAMKRLTTQLAEMKQILEDEKKTSIRLVVNAEKMVVKEAQRSYTFFSLFGYTVDLIIVNRVLPPVIEDHYFDRWKEIQETYLRVIKDSFSPVPIVSAQLYSREIVGVPLLEEIGLGIYQDRDPAQVFFAQRPIRILKEDGRFVLSLHLPFVEKAEVDLSQKGEELMVKVGPLKRNILLPRILLSRKVQGARFDNERLKIVFR